MIEYPRWVYSKHEAKIVNNAEEHEALGHGWHLVPPDEFPRTHPHDPIGKFHHHDHHPIEDDEITRKERELRQHQHQAFHAIPKALVKAQTKQRGRPAKAVKAKKGEED